MVENSGEEELAQVKFKVNLSEQIKEKIKSLRNVNKPLGYNENLCWNSILYTKFKPYFCFKLDSNGIWLIKWLNQRLICKYKEQTSVTIWLLSNEDVNAN